MGWIIGSERVVASRNQSGITLVSDPAFTTWDDHPNMLNRLYQNRSGKPNRRMGWSDGQPGFNEPVQFNGFGFLRIPVEILIVSYCFCIESLQYHYPHQDLPGDRTWQWLCFPLRLGRLGLPRPHVGWGPTQAAFSKDETATISTNFICQSLASQPRLCYL